MTIGIGAATNCGWTVAPLGGPAGTGLRLEQVCSDPTTGSGDVHELVGTRTGPAGPMIGQLTGGLVLGGLGAGAIAASAAGLGARINMGGIGKGIGIALGIGALVGAGLLINRSQQNRSIDYVVHFNQQPDLEGVPPGEVYAKLREHHERLAPAVERELSTMLDEGKVRSYSGVIGANGFVVEVVNRYKDEVEQRLGAIDVVGDVERSELA
ncbi:MAG: hypothetical protein KDC46_03215 [Thermoleophilia bacterium]|nr:hypothetical protein [Thermoleophilia bacterium]